MSKIEAQGSGKLPSQTVVKPRDNASAVALRNGKELEERPPASKPEDKDKDKKHNIENEKEVSTSNHIPHYITLPPFPSWLAPKKKGRQGARASRCFPQGGSQHTFA